MSARQSKAGTESLFLEPGATATATAAGKGRGKARTRAKSPAELSTGWVTEQLCGHELVKRVRRVVDLPLDLPEPMSRAAVDGLARELPTWLVRDDAGHLSVLVTNREPVSA